MLMQVVEQEFVFISVFGNMPCCFTEIFTCSRKLITGILLLKAIFTFYGLLLFCFSIVFLVFWCVFLRSYTCFVSIVLIAYFVFKYGIICNQLPCFQGNSFICSIFIDFFFKFETVTIENWILCAKLSYAIIITTHALYANSKYYTYLFQPFQPNQNNRCTKTQNERTIKEEKLKRKRI